MKNISKITAILFDLDGTLVDSLSLIRNCFYKVFQELNISWGNDNVMGWIGRPLKDIADYFAGEREDQFIKRYQYHFRRDHDNYTSLYPGTMNMMAELKRSEIKIGIVTSKGYPGTMKTLEFTGVIQFVDVIVTAYDVEKHKPFPDPVYKAMNMLSVGCDETLFIGDSHFDMEAGKAAGVKVLGVSWGICTADDLQRHEPEVILSKWDDLKLFLSKV